MCDALGFDSLWVRDHIFISSAHQEHGGIVDPGYILEAMLVLSALSSITSHARLGTAIVTPHRHPLKVAQLFGTLDQLSGGRAIFGIGAGWDANEFAALGLDFDQRIQMVRETVEICRLAWANNEFAYHGKVFDIPAARVNPRPLQDEIPIWYGGLSFKAVELAVELGNGWIPSRIPYDRLGERLARARDLLHAAGRKAPFTFAAMPQTSIRPNREDALARFDLDLIMAEALHRKPVSGRRQRLTLEDLEGYLIWGDASDICGFVERFINLGVTHIIFDMRMAFDNFEADVAILGEEVIPAFR